VSAQRRHLRRVTRAASALGIYHTLPMPFAQALVPFVQALAPFAQALAPFAQAEVPFAQGTSRAPLLKLVPAQCSVETAFAISQKGS